jgi:tape measure domain-containing protein
MAIRELLVRILGDSTSFRTATQQSEKAVSGFSSEISKLPKSISGTDGTISSLAGSIGKLSQAFGVVGIGAGIAAIGKNIFETRLQFESLEKGLAAMMGSSELARQELEKLKKTAELPGLGMKEAIQGSIALQGAGLQAETARRAIEGFGNALALVGRGKEDLDGVIKALQQIVGKGKVSAEEINQLAERLPQIRQLMKDAFGTADTEQLQKSGLGAQEFIDGIITATEKLPKAAGTMQNELSNLGDAWDNFANTLGKKIEPAIKLVTNALAGLLNAVSGSTWENVKREFEEFDKFQRKQLGIDVIDIPASVVEKSLGKNVLTGEGLTIITGKTKAEIKAAEEEASKAAKAIEKLDDALRKNAREFAEASAAIERSRWIQHLTGITKFPDFLPPTGPLLEVTDNIEGIAFATELLNRELVFAKVAFVDMSDAWKRHAAQDVMFGAEKKSVKELKDSFQDAQKPLIEVSTIITDLSRGIADAIFSGKKFGEVMKQVGIDIAKSLTRSLVQGVFADIGKALGGLLGNIPGLSSVFGSSVNSAASSAGGFLSAATKGISSVVSSFASISSAVTGVIGLFQSASQGKDIARLEVTSRGILSQLTDGIQPALNRYLPSLEGIHARLIEFRTVGIKVFTDGNQLAVAGVGGSIGGAGSTWNITINTNTNNPQAMADEIVRAIKQRL